MRISNQTMHNTMVKNMLSQQQDLAKKQTEVSTGKRLTTGSDDPVIAARISGLKDMLSTGQQYETNMFLAESTINMSSVVISGSSDVMTQMRSLGLEAGNGVVSRDDIRSIASAMEGLLDTLVDQMAVKDYNGEYIFSGSKSKSIPFAKNAQGEYVYQGDEARKEMRIDSNLTVETTVSGKEVFVIPSPTAVTTAHANNTGTGTIDDGTLSDVYLWKENQPNSYTVSFTSTTTFDVYSNITGEAVISNAAFEVDATDGSDANPTRVDINGMTVMLHGEPDAGDRFIIEPAEDKNILNVVQNFITYLNDYSYDSTLNGNELGSQVSHFLSGVESVTENLLVNNSRLSYTIDQIQVERGVREEVNASNSVLLEELENVNLVDVITEMSLAQTVLQATQSTFSQFGRLSLFSFL